MSVEHIVCQPHDKRYITLITTDLALDEVKLSHHKLS